MTDQCLVCTKPLGHDTKEQGFSTCHEHRGQDPRNLFAELKSHEPESSSIPTPPALPERLWDSQKSPELNAALLRVRELENDLAIIEAGRFAAERQLEYEKLRARELASNSVLTIKQDWVGLANEMAQLNGKEIGKLIVPEGMTEDEYKILKENQAMDFINTYRLGALALLEEDPDEILIVKSRAYEITWRACNYLLNSRKIILKVGEREKFETAKRQTVEKRVKVAKVRESKRRPINSEEKMVRELTILLGSEESARAHMTLLQEAASKAMKADEN